jgi:hypothetical protein
MTSSKWNLLWAAPWLTFSWLAVELFVFIPLFILGLPVLAVALKLAKIESRPSITPWKADVLAFKNPVLDWWLGNKEDGLCAMWWRRDHPTWSGWRLGWSWFVRNPLTNLRYAPIVGTVPRPARIRFLGADDEPDWDHPGWCLTWDGPYSGFVWQTAKFKLWIGWKLLPQDRFGILGYRQYGVGPAAQLRFKS